MGPKRRGDPESARTRRADDPAFYEGLGRAIRVLRVERGLERKDLAARSGISYPYLSEIEGGKKRPSSRALLALAAALQVAPHRLLASAEARRSTVAGEADEAEAAVHLDLGAEHVDLMEAPAEAAPPPREGPAAPGLARRSSYFRARADHAHAGGTRRSEEADEEAPGLRRPEPEAEEPVDPRGDLTRLVEDLSPEDARLLLRLARRLGGS